METYNSVFFITEIIGTIAFATSGAMIGIEKRFDLLGIIVLAVTTAVGGGMLRDILLGNVPPSLFLKPIYVITAFFTAILLFCFMRIKMHTTDGKYRAIYEKTMTAFDAVGLAAFTVTGVNTAIVAGYGEYRFLSVFLGVLTGVGGGLLRDIMAGQTPYILRKHIYACASIAGAISYVILEYWMSKEIAIMLSATLTISIRILSAHFCWNLPYCNH